MKQSTHHRKWNLKMKFWMHPYAQAVFALIAMGIDAATLYQAFEIGIDSSRAIILLTIAGVIWVIDFILYVLGNILPYSKKWMTGIKLAFFLSLGMVFACTWQTRSAGAEVRTVAAIEAPDKEKHPDDYKAYAAKVEKANRAFNQSMQMTFQMVTVSSTLFLLFLSYAGAEERLLWADIRQYRTLENQEYAMEQELMDIQNQPPLKTQLALSKAEAKAKIQQLDTENRVWIDQQKLRIAASTDDARAIDFSFQKTDKTDEEESV